MNTPTTDVTLLVGTYGPRETPTILACADGAVLMDNPEWWDDHVDETLATHDDLDASAQVTIPIPQGDLFARLYPATGHRTLPGEHFSLHGRTAPPAPLAALEVRLLVAHRHNTYPGEFPPEVLAARDEAAIQEAPHAWAATVAEERDKQGEDVHAWVQVTIPVPTQALQDALYPSRPVIPVSIPPMAEGQEGTFVSDQVLDLPPVEGTVVRRDPSGGQSAIAVRMPPRLALENATLLARAATHERSQERLGAALTGTRLFGAIADDFQHRFNADFLASARAWIDALGGRR